MDPPIDCLPMRHERGSARHISFQIDHSFPQSRMRPNRWHEGSSLDFLILDLTDVPLQQAVAVGMVISPWMISLVLMTVMTPAVQESLSLLTQAQ